MSDNNFFWIGGKHAVLSAIHNPSRVIKSVVIQNEKNSVLLKNKTKFEVKNDSFFNKIFSQTQITHQGFAAEITKLKAISLNEYLSENKKSNFLFVMLNNIQDNRNIGSIIRTSLAFGVDAIIVEKKNFRSKNPQMYKAACGSIEHLPIIEVSNLSNAIKILKENNVWTYSLEADAKKNINNITFGSKVCFIFGSENDGINNLIKKNSDELIKIPMEKNSNSLNVSNALTSTLTYYKLCK